MTPEQRYRQYVKDCLEDPEFEITSLESFQEWKEEEKECKCPSDCPFWTYERMKDEVCSMCPESCEMDQTKICMWECSK